MSNLKSPICKLQSKICNPKSAICNGQAFTLTELLIVISIISLLAGLALSALSGATELHVDDVARAIVAKLDATLNADPKWREPTR